MERLTRKAVWTDISERLDIWHGPKLATDEYKRLLASDLVDIPLEQLNPAFTAFHNSPEGQFPPKPFQIRAQVAIGEQLARKRRNDELDAKRAHYAKQDAEQRAKVIELDPEAAKMAGVQHKRLEGFSADCKDCADSGWFPFYLPICRTHPAAKYDLWLQAEVDGFPEEMQQKYRQHSAICDCPRGDLRFAENEAAVHQGWRAIKATVLEVHRRRVAKHAAKHGVAGT